MNDEQVLKLVKEAMAYANWEKVVQHDQLSLDDKLSDLGIDSIAALEMAAAMEEKLGVQFPDDELSGVSDVRGFVQMIRRCVPAVA